MKQLRSGNLSFVLLAVLFLTSDAVREIHRVRPPLSRALVLVLLLLFGCASEPPLTPRQRETVDKLCAPELRALFRASYREKAALCQDARCAIEEERSFSDLMRTLNETCGKYGL